jgi:hypothetical protein
MRWSAQASPAHARASAPEHVRRDDRAEELRDPRITPSSGDPPGDEIHDGGIRWPPEMAIVALVEVRTSGERH